MNTKWLRLTLLFAVCLAVNAEAQDQDQIYDREPTRLQKSNINSSGLEFQHMNKLLEFEKNLSSQINSNGTDLSIIQNFNYDFIGELKSFDNINGEIDVPYYSRPIHLGDINGDGNDDFAIEAYINNYLSPDSYSDRFTKSLVFLGGNTISQPSVIYGDLQYLGDTNGDGYDDVYLYDVYGWYGFAGFSYIFFGSETGIGSSYSQTGLFSGSKNLDLNNDGFSDSFYLSNRQIDGNTITSYDLFLRFGNSDADYDRDTILENIPINLDFSSFTYFPRLEVLPYPEENLFVLVISSITDQYQVKVLPISYDKESLNISVLGEQTLYPVESFPDVVLADANGNGAPELIVSDRVGTYGNSTIWELNEDTKLFNETPVYSGEIGFTKVGDINNDGFEELRERDRNSIHYGSATVYENISIDNAEFIYENSAIPSAFFSWAANEFDINGDGIADLFNSYSDNESNTSGISTAFGASDNNYTFNYLEDPNHGNHFTEFREVTTIGDINLDGIEDVAVVSNDYDFLHIHLGTNSGIDEEPVLSFDDQSFGSTGYLTIKTGDYNGDDIPDIMHTTYNGDRIGVYLSNGILNYSEISLKIRDLPSELPYHFFYNAMLIDLNNDGFDEIIAIGDYRESFEVDLVPKAWIWEGGANLESKTPIDITLDTPRNGNLFGFHLLSVGDLNGDGYNDLISLDSFNNSAEDGTNYAKIIFGNDDVSTIGIDVAIQSSQIDINGETYLYGQESFFAAGDVNLDGYDDIATIAYNSSTGEKRFIVWFGGSEMDEFPDEAMVMYDDSDFSTSISDNLRLYGRVELITQMKDGNRELYYGITDGSIYRIAKMIPGEGYLTLFDGYKPFDPSITYNTWIDRSTYFHNTFTTAYVSPTGEISYRAWLPYHDDRDAVSSTTIFGFEIGEIPIVQAKVGEAPSLVTISGPEIYYRSEFDDRKKISIQRYGDLFGDTDFYLEYEDENGNYIYEEDITEYKLAFFEQSHTVTIPLIIEDNDSDSLSLYVQSVGYNDESDLEDHLYGLGIGTSRESANLAFKEYDPGDYDSINDVWESDYESNLNEYVPFRNISIPSGDTLFIHLRFITDTTMTYDYNLFDVDNYEDNIFPLSGGDITFGVKVAVIDDGFNRIDSDPVWLTKNYKPTLELPLTLSMLEDQPITFQTEEILLDDQFRSYDNMELFTAEEEIFMAYDMSSDGYHLSFVPKEDFYGQHWVWFYYTDPLGETTVDSTLFTISPVNDAPEAVAQFSEIEVGVFEFINESNDDKDPNGAILFSNWDFGDGNTSTEFNATHTFEQNGEYEVRLIVTDNAGANDTTFLELVVEGLATSIEEHGLPVEFELKNNYPNPFNPSTNISYALPEAGFVNMYVINTLGQLVATLVNEQKPAGNYTVSFDASQLSSGVYFYTIEAGSFRQTKKMLLIK